jgi:hypothetical protein
VTAVEEAWHDRLVTLALQAASDQLPCVENGMLVLAQTVRLDRRRQTSMANLLSDLLSVLRGYA